jgi:hypothetical protein
MRRCTCVLPEPPRAHPCTGRPSQRSRSRLASASVCVCVQLLDEAEEKAEKAEAALRDQRKKHDASKQQAEAALSAAERRCAELQKKYDESQSQLRAALMNTGNDPNYRLAELKRRQALGLLTPEEEAELRRLQAELNAGGKGGGAGAAGDPRIPPGGSIGPGGVILDANGNPVLGADGKPLIAGEFGDGGLTDPRIPPGGSIGPGGVILDANGNPVLGADGKPLIANGAYGAYGMNDPRIPPGGSIGPGGIILDANGNPVLGADGKPLIAGAGGSFGPDGVRLDANGNPIGHGFNDPRIPPGGSIGPGGVILDANGNPVLGADGKPLIAGGAHGAHGMNDPRIPPGGSIGPGGVILDANGNPVLGADGKPLIANGYGAGGAGGRSGVQTAEIGVQTGDPQLKRRSTAGDLGGEGGGADGKGLRDLPERAVTSLCEIKFNRKDVKAMNVLMCRRLVAALYQTKAEVNASDDALGRARITMADFVPNQFVVLYGVKSLAIKNVRATAPRSVLLRAARRERHNHA